jgi:predicted outer membrane repeat protein
MRHLRGNSVNLGVIDGKGVPLEMTPEQRATHLYVCGSTGTGKSKMLEHLLRQDIAQWHENECGLLLLDPHGSLYDSLMNWIAWNEDVLKSVPIVPIDLRQKDWTIAYNVLRPRTQADAAVVVENFVQAMAYVWGVDGTATTPLFARNGKNIVWTLYENKLTLLESEYLIDRMNKQMRTEMSAGVSKRSVAQDWMYANSLSPKDFDAQISSTVNRFHTFLHNERLRLMFGQNSTSLDLGKAIEKGSIILVNLSTEGARVSEEDAALFATLLLSDLWTAAKERGKGTSEKEVKPFYVYMDEFQNFVTPTIAKNLDQARGFGLHLILANQFPRQILHTGANGAQVYDSVMANARSKVVFSTQGRENLEPLAFDLFIGVMDPDEIKHELYSTKVLDYVEETRTVRSTSESWSQATGQFTGNTATESSGGAVYDDEKQDARMWNESGADSTGTSHMDVHGGGSSKSEVPFLKPIMGKELSSLQFRPLEEQIFRGMAALHDQAQRHCVARLVENKRPFTLVTPTIEATLADKKMVKSFLTRKYRKLPFALKNIDAHKAIADREKQLATGMIQNIAEPTAIKRKVEGGSNA